MADHLMESYLDNIAEQVVDEDKIVTYKSLSRSLGIHVNTAKQLLHTYLTNEKSKNTFPISATYLVAGKVVDGSFNVTIVNEDDLRNTYSTFLEITSEHVYSVQKGKNLKEVKVLCGINKEPSNSENEKLVITCPKAVLKSRGESKKKVETFEESNKKAIIQALLPEKQKIAPEINVKKTETIVSKESTSKSPKKISPKGNAQKAQGNVQKPAGNIANMWAKAAQKNAGKPASVSGKNDRNVTTEEPKRVEDVIEVENTESRNLKKRSKSKESLKRKEKGNKRKRIQMLSDSDDSESNDEEEEKDVDEIEDSPPININIEEEETEAIKCVPQNKRKKRKVIDKTVMNEDGYLETKKEVVFETDSENESEVTSKETQKSKVEPVKATHSAGTAKKQSSLLTFFKKS